MTGTAGSAGSGPEAGAAAGTAMDKAALRASVRAARRALHPGERDRLDASLAAAALADGGPLAALPPGSAVAAYVSLPTEPGTRGLRAALAGRGLVVVVPVVLDGTRLAWRHDDGGAPWPGGLGAIDVVLLPALAVDGSGTRLGQGGGYYDRALAARTALAARPLLAAVVADAELLPAGTLPREAHDVAVDAALTPSGWHDVGR